MLGGRSAYQTLHRNLPLALPSISTTDLYIRQMNDVLIESQLRSQGLLTHLKLRKLPLIVSLSEDATRIVGRPQYDSKTNQILGFVAPIDENGMPIPFSFSANNADEIIKHFSGAETAHYVNVVMAQPLCENASPYCLLLYATNSKFTAGDVIKRWNFIKNEFKQLGITSLTFCSDSDPRLVHV